MKKKREKGTNHQLYEDRRYGRQQDKKKNSPGYTSYKFAMSTISRWRRLNI